MPFASFVCRNCGLCCTDVPGACDNTADDADITRWESEGRDDILEWVVFADIGNGVMRHTLWIDPETACIVEKCPWIQSCSDESIRCRIHSTKPRHCRHWPANREDAAYYGCACAVSE